ncbi:hypothetical protein TWF718_006868 [Orbilia javanica]|uniref:Uncharacterized protein n=1 Tax=Orbilia javanica TaxID=47235 RepID=A0AAN8MXQ2_9PEZI
MEPSRSPKQPSVTCISSSSSSSSFPSPSFLPRAASLPLERLPGQSGPSAPRASSTDAAHRRSLKRPRGAYEVAVVLPSAPHAANPAIEVVDLTTEDAPLMLPPPKRQKVAHDSHPSTPLPPPAAASPPAATPLSPPLSTQMAQPGDLLPPTNPIALRGKESEKVVIDLTNLESSASSGSGSIWSRSSSSSSGPASSSMPPTATFFPSPEAIFPPNGPKPLGDSWKTLGPIDEFPEDPIDAYYQGSGLYPFPEGPSSDIIAANPEVAYLFWVKSVAKENFSERTLTSADSTYLAPSTITTSFFISLKMDMGGLKELERDMHLARKIGFLPFRTAQASACAIKNYKEGKILRQHPGVRYWVGSDGGEKDRGPLDLRLDWYPGNGHFKLMAEEYMVCHPNIRGLRGIPGFASPSKWETKESKDIRKFNWEKWETEGLNQRGYACGGHC